MSQPPFDPHIGRVLAGHYRVEALLGRGGMGAVYRGLQLPVARPVAIKLISAGLPDPEQSLQRFRREAEATGRLKHPNTIRLFDFGLTEHGEVYMVMELLEGCDLAARLQQRGPLSLCEALHILRQMLSALSEAHALGIVHRDLKPGNVFLSCVHGSASFVKVMDFGIAGIEPGREAQKLTMTGAVMGTPAYMSPEQAQGKPVDARSDLYSCGVVLFEMLAGRIPFEADTLVSMLLAHVTQAPKRLAACGVSFPELERIQALIDRLLAKSPADRPTSAAEVIASIDALRIDAYSHSQHTSRSAAAPNSQLRTAPLAAAEPISPSTPVTPVAWDNQLGKAGSGARRLWIGALAAGLTAALLALRLWLPAGPTATVGSNTGTAQATSAATRAADGAQTSKPKPPPSVPPAVATSGSGSPAQRASVATTARTHTEVDGPTAALTDADPSSDTLADVPTPESAAAPQPAVTVEPRKTRGRRAAWQRRAARLRNAHRSNAWKLDPARDSAHEPRAIAAPASATARPTNTGTWPAPVPSEDVLHKAPPFPSMAAAKRALEAGKISAAAYEVALSTLKARRARRIAIEQQNLAQGRISAQEYEWRLGRIDQEYRGD